MTAFSKVFGGDFDAMQVDGRPDSEWVTITQKIGRTHETNAITLRSTEAVRDLHYALTRYLDVHGERT